MDQRRRRRRRQLQQRQGHGEQRLGAGRSAAAPGTVKVLATGVYAGIGGASFGGGDDASLQLGVPATSPRFIDNGDGTLADTVTGLTWLKQADCIIRRGPAPSARSTRWRAASAA